MLKEKRHMGFALGWQPKTAKRFLKEDVAKAEKPSPRKMKQWGLSRRERLLSASQFKSVYQQRTVVKDNLIWMYKMPNGLRFNRLGISVGNKFCANIVQRNKIKKIIRQIFQRNKQCFGKGVDIVLVLKKNPETVNYTNFTNLILGLSKR